MKLRNVVKGTAFMLTHPIKVYKAFKEYDQEQEAKREEEIKKEQELIKEKEMKRKEEFFKRPIHDILWELSEVISNIRVDIANVKNVLDGDQYGVKNSLGSSLDEIKNTVNSIKRVTDRITP